MIARATRATARAYDRVQDWLIVRPAAALALVLALWLAASAGIERLQLDLSFRPLFLADPESVERTREFERVFGQPSGAHALVIVERDAAFDAEALRALDEMAAALRHVPGIVEVLGGSRFVGQGRVEGRVKWVSADARRVLLAARFAAPMEDLPARRAALEALEREAMRHRPPDSRLHFTGVSVVESAYAERLLRDQIVATALTTLVLAALLASMFGSLPPVVVCLVPVGLAIPATLGLMGWAGAPITLINSVIPAIVLVIGISGAIHMSSAWLRLRDSHADLVEATRAMLVETRGACALAAFTSAIGFLSLGSARLAVIRDFGYAVATGIAVAWLANQLLLPWLLLRLRPSAPAGAGAPNRAIDAALAACTAAGLRRPGVVLAAGAALTLACGIAALRIETDQRFNQELAPDHPVSVAQRLLEREFGGFLGPELDVRRRDGAVLDAASQARLALARAALLRLPETDSVEEALAPPGERLAISVRNGDIGTRRALAYGDRVERVAREAFGPDYDVALVGPWWLAQRGMSSILGDMLRSIATSLLTVLPVLVIALRGWRLLVAGAAVNVAPMFVPLAFMYATGIELRIGTAVVTAIALGIAVDDTLHGMSRLHALARAGLDARAQVEEMIRTTGRALVYSNVALLAGFLSMLTNQFQAIRDMGLVAAVTFAAALLAELLLLPALYLALQPRPSQSHAIDQRQDNVRNRRVHIRVKT